MILKSFDFHCDFYLDFQITTFKMILILNHLYLGDSILILKSSTYGDFAHLCLYHIYIYIYIYIYIVTQTNALRPTKKNNTLIIK